MAIGALPYTDAQPRLSRSPARTAAHPLLASTAAWLAAIALGAVQALAHRHRFSSADLVSYLDAADAWRALHWKTALNGYWSPLYSWVLAIVMAVVRPHPSSEFGLVRLVNFAIYLGSFAAFRFLLGRLIATHEAAVGERHGQYIVLPRWIWMLLGYALFFWTALRWIGVRSDTPDMAGAALVYVVAGLLLDARRSGATWRSAVGVGALAGVLYLSKTAMVGMALTMLIVNAFVGGRASWRQRAVVGAIAFLVTAGPFIAGLSLKKGRLTIGDAGKLNYVWLVNPGGYLVPDEHWQGGPAAQGEPIHPSRVLSWRPAVFEFGRPVAGTYPPWSDPSYWYEGLASPFGWQREWQTMKINASFYGGMFFVALAAACLLLFIARGGFESLRALAIDNWMLVLPSITGLLTYLLGTNLVVSNIPTQPSTRYVAAAVVLLFGAMLSAVRLPDRRSTRRVVALAAVAAALTIGARLAIAAASDVEATLSPSIDEEDPWAVATALQRVGVHPGDRVAILGHKDNHEFWARLARVAIVVQLPVNRALRMPPPDLPDTVRAVLAATGAKVVVARPDPSGPVPIRLGPSWQALGETGYYFCPLMD